MLPQQFNRQGYLDVATQLGVKDKTAQGYITNFVKGGLLYRDEKDSYTKPYKEIQDTKDYFGDAWPLVSLISSNPRSKSLSDDYKFEKFYKDI